MLGGEACPSPSVPVVRLTISDEEGNPTVCTGTIVAEAVVLTAAHCLDGFVESVTVAPPAGSAGPASVRAVSADVHPAYRPEGPSLPNDLAVLRLERGFDGGPPPAAVRDVPLVPGEPLDTIGYGVVVPGGGPVPPSAPPNAGRVTAERIDESFIESVYDGTGQNPCSGDSGGPALVFDGGEWVVVGVTSTGTVTGCGPGDLNRFARTTTPAALSFLRAYLPGS